MGRLVTASLILMLVLAAVTPAIPAFETAQASSMQNSRAKSNSTELMKQSDHRRRVDQRKKAQAEQKQLATVAAAEADTGDSDYVVLVILIASAVLLAFVASRTRRARARW